jgi:16S rRNA (cytosine967-C5)-methyltransferase
VSKVTPARLIACDAFVEIMEKKRKPDDVLDELYSKYPGDVKRIDRNLTKEILFGGLRWYKKIFWILQHTSSRDLMKVSPQVRASLVLATYQIFYMDRVPERAAVNEAAEYIKTKKEMGAVGFVNGILRQIARRAEYFTKPDKKKQPIEYLALQFAHPEWLVSRWLPRFGFEKMETMLAANNQPPPLFIRVNTLKTPIDRVRDFQDELLKTEHMQSEKINIKCGLILKKHPDLGPESLFARGFYTIQDQASQIIPYLLNVGPDETILDASAGPGGKFAHIYELGAEKIALIGIEKDADQMQRAKDNMKRLGHVKSVTYIEADFLTVKPTEKISKILLDAPCTGLGVLRRHPEGKWHKDLSGIAAMSKRQREMIAHALTLLDKGGELLYSVCSFEPEESLEHLNWIKSEFNDKIEVISLVSRLPDYFKRYVTRENALMIYAGNQDDMDGFAAFAVKLK